jgi:hypothetical protein
MGRTVPCGLPATHVSKKPVPAVDLVDDEIRLKNSNVRDHWIMQRVCIFGDVEILLDNTARVG